MDISIMLDYIITFILMLYGDPTLHRNIVDKVMTFVSDFNKKFLLNSLQNEVINIINQSKSRTEMIVKINDAFQDHRKIFDTFLKESI